MRTNNNILLINYKRLIVLLFSDVTSFYSKHISWSYRDINATRMHYELVSLAVVDLLINDDPLFCNAFKLHA